MPHPKFYLRAPVFMIALLALAGCGAGHGEVDPGGGDKPYATPPEPGPGRRPPTPHGFEVLSEADRTSALDDLWGTAPEESLYTDGSLLPPVSFDAVVGADAAKRALLEMVATLGQSAADNPLGVRPPKGILLSGPPGVGKTLLARATATAAGINFFITTGSLIAQRSGGESPVHKLQQLFEMARQAAPAIVFIDELDVLRYEFSLSKQLGVELDGFVANAEVYVLAAVNDVDSLDKALLRAGRFDHVIHVPLPNAQARAEILRRAAANTPQASDVDFDKLAILTDDKSGAELVNLANLAALRAQRQHRAEVALVDWEEALDDIDVGQRDEAHETSPAALWLTAVHEAGHAAVASYISQAIDVRKATVVARGPAAGYTLMMPPADVQVLDKRYYLDMLAVGLGGRAAEELIFGSPTPGAASDLQAVTQMAQQMVVHWGMGERLGPVERGDVAYSLSYSEYLRAMVEADTQALVHEAHRRAQAIVREHEGSLRALAAALQARSELTGAQVVQILRDTDAGEPTDAGTA